MDLFVAFQKCVIRCVECRWSGKRLLVINLISEFFIDITALQVHNFNLENLEKGLRFHPMNEEGPMHVYHVRFTAK